MQELILIRIKCCKMRRQISVNHHKLWPHAFKSFKTCYQIRRVVAYAVALRRDLHLALPMSTHHQKTLLPYQPINWSMLDSKIQSQLKSHSKIWKRLLHRLWLYLLTRFALIQQDHYRLNKSICKRLQKLLKRLKIKCKMWITACKTSKKIFCAY